jgi:ATP-dependent Lon protease
MASAGVRNLDRALGAVCRSLAARLARGLGERALSAGSPSGPLEVPAAAPRAGDGPLRDVVCEPVTVSPDDLEDCLGPPRFEREIALIEGVAGVVTGLAYTPAGGDIIFIEASLMPGRGGFTMTGQIGDVMRESATAALSLVRARARDWGLDATELPKSDIHIHVPAGGIPKDGPSAGVAIVAALVSLLAGQSADPSVGMTGEITLRGLVLPVGGIREKVLSAHRAGLKTVVLPARNRPDLADVPAEVRQELRFVLVERIDEVLRAVFPAAAGTDKTSLKKAKTPRGGKSAAASGARRGKRKPTGGPAPGGPAGRAARSAAPRAAAAPRARGTGRRGQS